MHEYMIEFRLSGYSKNTIKDLMRVISSNISIRKIPTGKIIPHVTLVGPLTTYDEKTLIKTVKNITNKCNPIKFKFNGFGIFPNRAVYVKITPSNDMVKLRNNLVEKLSKFCILNEYDYQLDYIPHVTLLFNNELTKRTSRERPEREFNKVIKFLNSYKNPDLTVNITKITLLKNAQIIYEYDLNKKLNHNLQIHI